MPICCPVKSANTPPSLPTAAQLAGRYPDSPAAEVILLASSPWSPFTHELWGDQHRTHAAELCKIGYQLAYGSSMSTSSFAHAWIWHVMPHAMSWRLPVDSEAKAPGCGSQSGAAHALCAAASISDFNGGP